MTDKADQIAFKMTKELIEADLAPIEKATDDLLAGLRAYLAAPDDDVLGLRLLTLIDRAHSLGRTYGTIETLLKRLQEREDTNR